jgi:trk system potassium uptake protein TrkA
VYILIVGGGKVGFYLAKTLLADRHTVGLVEKEAERCRVLAGELGVTVIAGDGTDLDILRDAGADEADYVAAVTGKDEENLVICQLAKRHFKAPLTIARVNDPKNQSVFKLLGVDATVSSTAIAAQMIENVLPLNGMRIFSVFQQGDVEIVEAELTEGSPVAGQQVSQLRLPEECVLITVMHDGRIFFPRGKTVLAAGDRVFALARRQSVQALKAVLLGGRE